MTAEQWLTCIEPGPMLELLRGQGDRRLRLLACACARVLWERAYHQSRAAVEVAERYADGLAADEELDAAEAEASRVVDGDLTFSTPDTAGEYYATAAAAEAAGRAYHWSTPDGLYTKKATVWDCARKAAELVTGAAGHYSAAAKESARREVCHLVRDVFGNPFRAVAFSPDWRAETAILLARQMYESRDFGAMPILADALQDTGCDNEDVLTHCRSQCVHVRGCWAVDFVLGKE